MEKDILIWGAGKIGRGFIGDLFQSANYQITFIDSAKGLVDKLNENRKYTVHKLVSETEGEKTVIQGFTAVHTSEKKRITELLTDSELMALAVFPDAFDETGKELAEAICIRAQKCPNKPLDILVCTNITHPAEKLAESVRKHLPADALVYFAGHVGLIECLVIRMAVQPQKEMLAQDELVVVTNGYPDLIVDKTAFKGSIPAMPGLVFSENIVAEEQRKMLTYNMVHALYAYTGITKGYEYVYECTSDEEVNAIAESALGEIGEGLIRAYGFSRDEMEQWNKRVLANMANPILKDKLLRVGGDPVRKLKRNDRLTGAALLCRNNGIMPYYLAKAIAYGFLFCHEEDMPSVQIQRFIKKFGLKKAVIEYCGLDREPELVQMIFDHYCKALELKPLREGGYQSGRFYQKGLCPGFRERKKV